MRSFILGLLAAASIWAQNPTTIADTVVNGSGQPVYGTISIVPNQQFTALGPHVVYPTVIQAFVAADGTFSVQLYPNDTATPTGTYYLAYWSLTNPDGSQFNMTPNPEIWEVPTSASPVTLSSVRVSPAPPPGFSGIVSLNGLTANTQLFARTNDTNLGLTITSAASTHTFALNWIGTLANARIANPFVVVNGTTCTLGAPCSPPSGQCSNCIDSSVFNFSPQSPSGTLTASSPATVILSPVPAGVNGTDTNHRLYIPSCSGGAQSVLITGGTAVSGAPSGTIIFTPSNSCNAGWQIASATGGVAEAQQYLAGTGGVVWIGSPITFYASVTGIASTPIHWSGPSAAGPGKIIRGFASGDLFTNSSGSFWEFSNLFFVQGIGIATTGAAIHIQAGASNIHDVTVFDGQYGYLFTTTASGHISNSSYTQLDYSFKPVAGFAFTSLSGSFSADGIYTNGSSPTNSNVVAAGVLLKGTDTIEITNSELANADVGLGVDNTNGAYYNVNVAISNSVIIDNRSTGISIAGNSAVCSNLAFTGLVIQGDSDGTNSTTGQGFGIDWGYNSGSNSCDHVTFSGGTVTGFQFAGIAFREAAESILFEGVNVFDDNRGNHANNGGYLVATGATGLNVVGGYAGNATGGFGYSQFGIYLLGTMTGSIVGVDLSNNTTAPLNTGFTGVLEGVRGISNVIASVADAATIAWPNTPDFLITGSGTAVTAVTMTAVPPGSSGTFRTTGGALTFTAGGGIGNTITTTQNVPVVWTWDGTNLWLK